MYPLGVTARNRRSREPWSISLPEPVQNVSTGGHGAEPSEEFRRELRQRTGLNPIRAGSLPDPEPDPRSTQNHPRSTPAPDPDPDVDPDPHPDPMAFEGKGFYIWLYFPNSGTLKGSNSG